MKNLFSTPIKIIFEIKKLIFKINFKKDNFIEEQNRIFTKLGLDRIKGIEKLRSIINENSLKKNSMSSEHEIIFSAISLLNNFKANSILEIGTYDGRNAKLLSYLFSDSKIITLDLDENDEDFKNYYHRSDKESFDNFINTRNQNLDSLKNVTFFKKNSLQLLNYKGTFDLIWIDGAHGYPFVTIDIINSLKLISSKGIILCDDIFINNFFESDKMYRSIGGFETLKELQKANLLKFDLIYKRLDAASLVPENRKFIALITPTF